MKFIIQALRSIFFSVGQLFLILADWGYGIVNAIFNINLSQNSVAFIFIRFSVLFIAFFTSMRLISMLLGYLGLDDEQEPNKFNSAIFKRLAMIALVVVMLPYMFVISFSMAQGLNDIFVNNISYGMELRPSTSVVNTMAQVELSGDFTRYNTNEAQIITLEQAVNSLNVTNPSNPNQYMYFYDWGELFLFIVISIIVAFSVIYSVAQICTLVVIILFRYMISFIPISSLIDPNDNSFELWLRDTVADIFRLAFAMIGFNTILLLMVSDQITGLPGIVKIVFLIIGLNSVSIIGNMISTYLKASDVSKPSKVASAMIALGTGLAVKGVGQTIGGIAQMAGNFGSSIVGGGVVATSNNSSQYRGGSQNLSQRINNATSQTDKSNFFDRSSSYNGNNIYDYNQGSPEFDATARQKNSNNNWEYNFKGITDRNSPEVQSLKNEYAKMDTPKVSQADYVEGKLSAKYNKPNENVPPRYMYKEGYSESQRAYAKSYTQNSDNRKTYNAQAVRATYKLGSHSSASQNNRHNNNSIKRKNAITNKGK